MTNENIMLLEKDKILLRIATTNDIDILIYYRLQFLKEIQGQPSEEMENQLRQSLREYFSKTLLNNSFIAWIAEYKGVSISFGGIVIREQPGNFEIPDGKTGYILNMYTVPEYRNNGIGTMIFRKLLEEGKSHNLSKIELHATLDGEPIYRKYGFSIPHDKAMEITIKKIMT